MSNAPHVVWALRQRGLTAAERLVLIYLADRANGAMVCWPMISAIAEALELSVRAVMRAVQVLEQRGLIRVERRHRQFNHYHVLRPANGHDPEPEYTVTIPDQDEVRVTESHPSVTVSHPNRVTVSHTSVPASHPKDGVWVPASHSKGDSQSPKQGVLGDSQSPLRIPQERIPQESPKSPPRAHAHARREIEPLLFDVFWELYPRKVGRRTAAAAFAAAVNRGTPADVIVAGLRGYQFHPNPKFRQHPTTWLRGDHWRDEVDNFDPVLRAVGLSEADFPKPGRLLQ